MTTYYRKAIFEICRLPKVFGLKDTYSNPPLLQHLSIDKFSGPQENAVNLNNSHSPAFPAPQRKDQVKNQSVVSKHYKV